MVRHAPGSGADFSFDSADGLAASGASACVGDAGEAGAAAAVTLTSFAELATGGGRSLALRC